MWTELRIQTNSCQLILQLQFSCGCKSRLDMNSQPVVVPVDAKEGIDEEFFVDGVSKFEM